MEEKASYEVQFTPEEVFKGIGAAVKQMAVEAVRVAVENEKANLEAMQEAVTSGIGNHILEFEAYYEGVSNKVSTLIMEKFQAETVAEVKSFINRSGVQELRSTVAALPNEIEAKRQTLDEKRINLRRAKQGLGDIEQSLKEAEAMLIAEIDGDKAKYPNATARKNALLELKKSDQSFIEAKENYRAAKWETEGKEDEISRLETEYKAMKNRLLASIAQIESITAETKFYAAALGAAGTIQI